MFPRGLRFFSSCRRNLGYWDALYKRNQAKDLIEKPVVSYARMDLPALMSTVEPPAQASMLARDFIHNSLYNPSYGYFSRNVMIFNSPEIEFTSIRDMYHFWDHVADMYKKVDDQAVVTQEARQLWHTPSELFNPWYGYAIANYIAKTAKKANMSRVKIVEVGGGNGTLMSNIMSFLRQSEPEVYCDTSYTIIEISQKLAARQAKVSQSFDDKVRIVKSFFDCTEKFDGPIFVLAMEVLDNLAHDVIRYDYETGEPYQGIVTIDDEGSYSEGFEKLADTQIRPWKSSALSPAPVRGMRRLIPFAPNLTGPEFIPTMSLKFMEKLRDMLPEHLLIISDFSKLPKAISGECGPVVQTRYNGTMIPCSTYLVQPGWFDIFFPTNFARLKQLHEHICRPSRNHEILSQKDFIYAYADISKTKREQNQGRNPMLSLYENFSFYLQHRFNFSASCAVKFLLELIDDSTISSSFFPKLLNGRFKLGD
ncbi:S-adenosyl-L-methionine-dependent methyltransferase [Chytridium lagenaria]|nr:S-adenosyl-L-methionine-dependent methyltransferase [Chytridium lagenaria]